MKDLKDFEIEASNPPQTIKLYEHYILIFIAPFSTFFIRIHIPNRIRIHDTLQKIPKFCCDFYLLIQGAKPMHPDPGQTLPSQKFDFDMKIYFMFTQMI
jgi:hypothetical protein